MKWNGISRVSLLWKILLATSIALTLLFAATGWFVQSAATNAIERSLENEVQASFQAYDSLWRSRAGVLASVSLVLSRMSDVRRAFDTGDEATIRDTASELWSQISNQDAVFLVTDPHGKVLASLGGAFRDSFAGDLPVVQQSASRFPAQASGFMTARGKLYQIAVTPVYVQGGASLGLLNVLVAGYPVNGDVVSNLKNSTGGSDFCFLSGGQVVASTLPPDASARIQAEGGRPGNFVRIDTGGGEYAMLGSTLVDVEGKPIGELRILRSFEGARREIAGLRRIVVLMWLLSMILGLLLTYTLARRILKPVGELDRAADEVASGNYDYRVPVADGPQAERDELGRLAQAFNDMCASIKEGRNELIRQERIATIGRLSTSIVHDLRNPLAAIYGGAEMLMDGELSQRQVQRLAGNIYRSSRSMQQLLQELVDAGRGKTTSAEVCRLKDVVCAAVEVHAERATRQGVDVELTIPESIELPLERARMERVFLNMIDNALGVMPKGGQVRIFAAAAEQVVTIHIEDTGPGIAPHIRGQLFQPFVTAGKKNGVGLGLAFSHQTALDHGGQLWAENGIGKGAHFVLKLPL